MGSFVLMISSFDHHVNLTGRGSVIASSMVLMTVASSVWGLRRGPFLDEDCA
jgi:hypothetical protein